jgi:hypothetical protein
MSKETQALVILPLPTLDEAQSWKAFLEEEHPGVHVVATTGTEEIRPEEGGTVTVKITLDGSWRAEYARRRQGSGPATRNSGGMTMDVYPPEEATMVDHSKDNLGEHGEPDGGWVSAPQLIDTELLTIVLCRFTGEQLASLDDRCEARTIRLHPDEDCAAVYVQFDALDQGRTIDMQRLAGIQEELRVPFGGENDLGPLVVALARHRR